MSRWPTRTLEERFWSKVDKSGECWIWTGATRTSGYGAFAVPPGRVRDAHRMSFELSGGEIPAGAFVCHHCDTPRCVRPGHLFIGTPADNTHDMVSKQRHNPWAGLAVMNRMVRKRSNDGRFL